MSYQITTTPNDNDGFLITATLEQAMEVAKIIADSAFCPKAFIGKPGDVLVCMQMGKEVGLKPMQALQNIAVINGRPSVWGDAMVAICRQAPDFEYLDESYDDTSKTATCRAKRKNEPEVVRYFSEDEAKKASLWGKPGPWTQYPKRMLQMRARGFALRDAFADTLRGIITREEAEDIPNDERVDYTDLRRNIVDAEVLISTEQFAELKDKIKQAGSEEIKICEFAKVEKLEQMNQNQWAHVMRLLAKKIADRAQSDMMQDLAKNKGKPNVVNATAANTTSEPQDTTVEEFFSEEGA